METTNDKKIEALKRELEELEKKKNQNHEGKKQKNEKTDDTLEVLEDSSEQKELLSYEECKKRLQEYQTDWMKTVKKHNEKNNEVTVAVSEVNNLKDERYELLVGAYGALYKFSDLQLTIKNYEMQQVAAAVKAKEEEENQNKEKTD